MTYFLFKNFIQVPYELLNKKFRTVQKVIDRDIIGINGGLGDLTSSVSNNTNPPSTEVLSSLDNLTQKLESFKKKVSETTPPLCKH